jgi:hypothetical protein
MRGWPLALLLSIVIWLILYIIILNIQKSNVRKEKEAVIKVLIHRIDSLQSVNSQLQHEGEVLMEFYRNALKYKDKAEAKASESAKQLRNEKSRIIRYSVPELDSIRAVHFGQH